jgi:hypothetical protein
MRWGESFRRVRLVAMKRLTASDFITGCRALNGQLARGFALRGTLQWFAMFSHGAKGHGVSQFFGGRDAMLP